MAEQFIGNWKLVKTEHFDEYLKEVGVNLIVRKAVAHVKSTLEIKKDNDVWTFDQKSTFKDTVINFKLGEEFDETTPDGRKYRTTVTYEDGKMIIVQKKIKDSEQGSTIVRWIENGKMIVKMTAGSVEATAEYEKI